MAKTDLTAQRLREMLDYCPETGEFRWLGKRQGAPKNRAAGCVNRDGYRFITIDGKMHLAHRLAWLFIHGEWPNSEIDHKNGDTDDNRMENLRDVPPSTNMQNLRVGNIDSRSGLLGVHWDKPRSRWAAVIYVAKKRIFLGRFDRPEDAHAVYLAAKRRLHAGCTI